jgi:hypothetical protein
VRPSRQQPQHAGRIVRISRLAEDDVIDHHDRIRAQHPFLRPVLKNRQRLLPRQPLRAIPCSFPGKRCFINFSRLNRERNPSIAQQLLASR